MIKKFALGMMLAGALSLSFTGCNKGANEDVKETKEVTADQNETTSKADETVASVEVETDKTHDTAPTEQTDTAETVENSEAAETPDAETEEATEVPETAEPTKAPERIEITIDNWQEYFYLTDWEVVSKADASDPALNSVSMGRRVVLKSEYRMYEVDSTSGIDFEIGVVSEALASWSYEKDVFKAKIEVKTNDKVVKSETVHFDSINTKGKVLERFSVACCNSFSEMPNTYEDFDIVNVKYMYIKNLNRVGIVTDVKGALVLADQ